jgi:oligoribonuclease NrnB/cAMP/cGMP phosphodiesterase (DHH superfamily)
MSKKFIITDTDLDGAMSYLLFKWYHKESIPYKAVSITNFASWYNAWSEKYAGDYDEIIILDLDVGSECMNLVDKKNIKIFDHHETHVAIKNKYKHADVSCVKTETSCAKLIYKTMKLTGAWNNYLTSPQQLLVAMVDDYDCYALKLPSSYELNIIFWNYQGDKISRFESDFGYGFKGFNPEHARYIAYRKNKIKEKISEVPVYKANLKLIGKERVLVSTFCDEYINDIADHLLAEYNADAAFIVNPKTSKCSIRRGSSSDLDILKIVDKIFDEGGGHAYAAGGNVCDKFMEFTKLFNKVR